MNNHVYKFKMGDNLSENFIKLLTWIDPNRLYTYFIDWTQTLTVKGVFIFLIYGFVKRARPSSNFKHGFYLYSRFIYSDKHVINLDSLHIIFFFTRSTYVIKLGILSINNNKCLLRLEYEWKIGALYMFMNFIPGEVCRYHSLRQKENWNQ